MTTGATKRSPTAILQRSADSMFWRNRNFVRMESERGLFFMAFVGMMLPSIQLVANRFLLVLVLVILFLYSSTAACSCTRTFSAAGVCENRSNYRFARTRSCQPARSSRPFSLGIPAQSERSKHFQCWMGSVPDSKADQTKIGAVSTHVYSEAEREASRVDELEAWFHHVGIDRGGSSGGREPPSVRLKKFPGQGMGLECARALERDSTVASIPRRVCLSSDPSDAPTGTLRAWAHSILTTTPLPTFATRKATLDDGNVEDTVTMEHDVVAVTLQLFLESAAGKHSSSAPWIQMLPLEEETIDLPVLWPDVDRAGLRGTVVWRDSEECLARAVAERSWAVTAIKNGLDNAEVAESSSAMEKTEVGDIVGNWSTGVCQEMRGRPTVDEWLRARCAVQSRAYRVGGRYLLIPLVDFANHDDDVAYALSPGDGVFTNTDEVVLSTDRSYHPGQQVCTTYGDMDNAKRLYSFGFVTLSHPGSNQACLERSTKSTTPPSDHTDSKLALPTEAYCDVSFDVESTDPLYSLKTTIWRKYWRNRGEDVTERGLSAVFRLCARDSPHLSVEAVRGQARSFMESAMPLLRLAALTPADLRNRNMTEFSLYADSEVAPKVDVELWADSLQKTKAVPMRLFLRLEGLVSWENEQRAFSYLEQQCHDCLREIRVTSGDVAQLKAATSDARGLSGEGGAEAFAVKQPRSLLCAVMRVAESFAWLALLIACRRRGGVGVSDDDFGVGIRAEQTVGNWLVDRIDWVCK